MDETVSPHAPQIPQAPFDKSVMSNVEIRFSIHSLTQVLATHVSWDYRVQVNPDAFTTPKMRYFKEIIPPTLFISNVEEDS